MMLLFYFRYPLLSINDEKHRSFGRDTSVDETSKESAAGCAVLSSAFVKTKNVLIPVLIDSQCQRVRHGRRNGCRRS